MFLLRGRLYVPWSKVPILGMVIPPFNRNPYNSWVYKPLRTWVDEFIPLLYGIMGVFFDPIAHIGFFCLHYASLQLDVDDHSVSPTSPSGKSGFGGFFWQRSTEKSIFGCFFLGRLFVLCWFFEMRMCIYIYIYTVYV